MSACFKTHGRAFQILSRAFQTLNQAIEALKENQKQEFEKIGRVFKKARPRVCVTTRSMLYQTATVSRINLMMVFETLKEKYLELSYD